MKRFTSALLVAAFASSSMLPVAFAAESNATVLAQAPIQDPKLKQNVTGQETIAPKGTKVAIDHGHADLGPMILDDKFEFLVRDDSAEKPVWRYIEDVIFPVGEKAQLQLPANGQFDFTGAKGGQQVWVVPQTEIPGVVWLGWNTQHPTIRDTADRGVTMEFLGHQGPGQYTLFLQAGGFAKPQQLFNSANTSDATQSMWVDVNTHTHANWVFTEPGVHHIALRISMKRLDGSTVEATKILNFAVGVPAEQAVDSTWSGPLPTGDASDDKSSKHTTAHSGQQESKTVLWAGLGLLAVATLLGHGAWQMKASARRRRRAAESIAASHKEQ